MAAFQWMGRTSRKSSVFRLLSKGSISTGMGWRNDDHCSLLYVHPNTDDYILYGLHYLQI